MKPVDFKIRITDDIEAVFHIYDNKELAGILDNILSYDWSNVQQRLNRIHPKNVFEKLPE